MYTSGLLSLGNIHQLAKGGMAKSKKNIKKGGQEPPTNPEPPKNPESTAAPAPTVAPAPLPAPPSQESTGAPEQPAGAQEETEKSFFSRMMETIRPVLDIYSSQTEKIVMNTPNSFSILLGILIFCILFAFVNNILYFIKRNKTYKIKPEDRYNKDLIEYNMAKNPNMFKNPTLLTYTILGLIPFLLLFMVIFITSLFVTNPNSPNNTFKEILLFVSVFGVFSILLILAYFVNYIMILKDLKRIRKRIDLFENFVYSKFYINGSFLQILYNKGVATDNPNAIIRKAIKDTLLRKDVEEPDIDTITKITYTLNIYYFLNKDLVEDEARRRYYKTNSLEVFNPSLVMLPGKSRIFRIGDYMRSNIPANMDDLSSISNILGAMNVILKLDNDIITRIKIQVKNDILQTRSLASKIGAYQMDKKILILVLISTFTYILVALILVILTFKASKGTNTEGKSELSA